MISPCIQDETCILIQLYMSGGRINKQSADNYKFSVLKGMHMEVRRY